MNFPYCFAGMLSSVVMGQLGVRGVVLTGPAGGMEGEALKKLTRTLAPGRTVVAIGNGKGGWLRERSELLRAMEAEKEGVMIL